MICPFCSNEKLKVLDKRNSPKGIRRRRECLKCKGRFTTYEKIENRPIYVLKRDKRSELFQIEKLERGIDRAFEKRSTSGKKIKKMIKDIEDSVRRKKEVKSSFIGDLIMKKIKKLDKVAYIRFASVYREFEDVKDFKKEIREL